MKRAQIRVVKEPVGLMRQDGKRPDGTNILPWSRGKLLAWDVTVPDTYPDAHVASSARQAGTAATHAANNKTTKKVQPATHIFYAVAIETAGTWVELILEIGITIIMTIQTAVRGKLSVKTALNAPLFHALYCSVLKLNIHYANYQLLVH